MHNVGDVRVEVRSMQTSGLCGQLRATSTLINSEDNGGLFQLFGKTASRVRVYVRISSL